MCSLCQHPAGCESELYTTYTVLASEEAKTKGFHTLVVDNMPECANVRWLVKKTTSMHVK